jgi:hypothetical protein
VRESAGVCSDVSLVGLIDAGKGDWGPINLRSVRRDGRMWYIDFLTGFDQTRWNPYCTSLGHK